MERLGHDCKKIKPGYFPVVWEGTEFGHWRCGTMVLIDYCPYCGAKLERPRSEEIEAIRAWLSKQKDTWCCINSLPFNAILNQVERDGLGSLSPKNLEVYQWLKESSERFKEAPDDAITVTRSCLETWAYLAENMPAYGDFRAILARSIRAVIPKDGPEPSVKTIGVSRMTLAGWRDFLRDVQEAAGRHMSIPKVAAVINEITIVLKRR